MLEEEVDFKGKSTMTQNAKDGPRVYKSMDNAVERRKFGVRNEDGVVRNHINAEKATDRGFVPRSVTKSGRDFPNRCNDNSLEVERAAYQSFDEFGDIMDKPRVSQMEMEQRIQKLAKWRNGADIDMPEWMFSKMMRSAQIRFTDHSILRVIQLLGILGNWRWVLQVIEWLQMRERFKSHKLRYIYTTALDVLGKARRPVEALNIHHAMLEQMSSYPDLVAYHSIAVTLGQAGHMRELFDVIDTMRSPPKKKFKTGALGKWDPRLEPDLVVFHAVLNAFVQRKQWEGAFWVLQQLKQQGLQPAATTYGLVVEVMLACGKVPFLNKSGFVKTPASQKRGGMISSTFTKGCYTTSHFNAKRHLRMILNACRAGKVELPDITWMHLTEAGRIPPPPLTKERSWRNSGILEDSVVEEKLCKENAEGFQEDTFVRLVHEGSILVNRTDWLNPVFQNLMAACGELDTTRLTETAGSELETVCTTKSSSQ